MIRKALFATAGLLIAAGAHAAPVFSDNFDGENGNTTVLNYTGFANFTVTDGTVDLIGTPSGYSIVCAGGAGACVDLDGTTGNPGALTSSAIDFAAGDYTLTFDLSGNQRTQSTDTVTVSLGSLLNETISLAGFDPFQTFSFNFSVVAPTTASLIFQNDGSDNIGAILDNVAINGGADPVPEPGMIGLLGLGLLGLGVARRRRTA